VFDFTSVAVLNWCYRCSAVDIEQILFFVQFTNKNFCLQTVSSRLLRTSLTSGMT